MKYIVITKLDLFIFLNGKPIWIEFVLLANSILFGMFAAKFLPVTL